MSTSTRFWNQNATTWATAIQEKRIASRSVTNQAIVNQVLASGVSSLVDLGCGEGWLSAAFKTDLRYHGMDASSELVKIAKANHGDHFSTVAYEEIIAGQWKPTEKFEAAVFNFSLMQENLAPLLREVGTALSGKGLIFIQTLHPCFVLNPYQDGWQVEDFKNFPLRFEGNMDWYGRTLSSWLHEFEKAGLKLREMHEPSNGTQPLSVIFTLSR